MLNLQTFTASFNQICDNYKQHKFLLAISGGVDSMVLLHLFKEQNLNFEVANVNYKLREEASENDRKLVEKICKEMDVSFHLYEVSEDDNKPKNSIQNWARDLRYHFFRKIQKKKHLDFIVTAHHLNDELETFIINLSKASGIKGLSGIPTNENSILRPFLNFSKQEIYDFARKNKIEFREDASNEKNDYLRNKIRNEIAPKLLETNENFLGNFAKSLSYLKATKNFVEEKIVEIEKELLSSKEDFLLIQKDLFFKQSDYIQFEILRKYFFQEVNELKKIQKAAIGKVFYSSEYELTIDRNTLNLRKRKAEIGDQISLEIWLELNIVNEIVFPKNIWQKIKELGDFDWKLDGEKLQFPLKLRRKKDGDVFYPIGMIGKKKISKYIKDEKIPIFAQQNIWILCDVDDQILGVLPFRQDRRFVAKKGSLESIKIK